MAAMLYEEGYSDILPPQVGLNHQLEYPQVIRKFRQGKVKYLPNANPSPTSVSVSVFRAIPIK